MTTPEIRALQARLEQLETTQAKTPATPRTRGGAPSGSSALLAKRGEDLPAGQAAFTPGIVYYRNGLGATWAAFNGDYLGGLWPALALDEDTLLLAGRADLTLDSAWSPVSPAIDVGSLLVCDDVNPSLVRAYAAGDNYQPIALGTCLRRVIDLTPTPDIYQYTVAWQPALHVNFSSAEITAGDHVQWLDVEACENGAAATIRLLGAKITP